MATKKINDDQKGDEAQTEMVVSDGEFHILTEKEGLLESARTRAAAIAALVIGTITTLYPVVPALKDIPLGLVETTIYAISILVSVWIAARTYRNTKV